MTPYHLRHPEQEIADRATLLEILAGQRTMALAMCHDGEPYLVTVNYAFDPTHDCFYFHAAPEGKKIDYLKANPLVWGQVVEDRGYLDGRCDHAYRSVHFRGRAEFLEDAEEKRQALALLIEQQESDPAAARERFLRAARIVQTAVIRVRVEAMWGKKNPA